MKTRFFYCIVLFLGIGLIACSDGEDGLDGVDGDVRQRTQRANRVAEQRVGTVEGVDVSIPVLGPAPSRRLHGTADLQPQLAGLEHVLKRRDAPVKNQPPQIAIRTDIIEPVVVHPDMADM